MKVCWFGIYDPKYSRNKILIDGLRENGVDVVECNIQGKGINKYITLIKKIRALNNQYDLVYCAFPVHVSIFLAYFFQSKPIYVDAFFSKYDAIVEDRKTHFKFHPVAMFAFAIDYFMIRLSDRVIVDTDVHKKYWSKWCNPERVFVIPVGTHDKEFFPLEPSRNAKKYTVQFHGSYIPLQGIDKIVKAAAVLKDQIDIRFRFIGGGQTFKEIQRLINDLQVDIEIIQWSPIDKLNLLLNEADVILGIFGDTEKTNMVIPNKVFQGMAVCKPVITKDTPAIHELFSPRELLMVGNTPDDIAAAIMELKSDSAYASRIASAGYARIVTEFNQKALGKKLAEVFKSQDF